MVVKASGSLGLGTDIAGEFGGSTPHSLSEYYRNGSLVSYNNPDVPTSGPLTFSTYYNKRKRFVLNITSNVNHATLATLLTAAGWNGDSYVEVNIAAGVYLWASSTASAGLIISSSITNGLVINNSGKIMGMGGLGGNARSVGAAGGPAIRNFCSDVVFNNLSGGYIAGGGGGGGGGYQAGGGGGAGGAAGGYATDEYDLTYRVYGGAGGAVGLAGADGDVGDNLEESHAQANQAGQGGTAGGSGGGVNVDDGSDRDPVGGGGGGGRVLGGTGVNALIPTGTHSDWCGGYGGGPLQAGGDYGHYLYTSPTTIGGSGASTQGGGGGGGWGAAGGAGYAAGGAAGKSIQGITGMSLNNSGIIYGATA